MIHFLRSLNLLLPFSGLEIIRAEITSYEHKSVLFRVSLIMMRRDDDAEMLHQHLCVQAQITVQQASSCDEFCFPKALLRQPCHLHHRAEPCVSLRKRVMVMVLMRRDEYAEIMVGCNWSTALLLSGSLSDYWRFKTL